MDTWIFNKAIKLFFEKINSLHSQSLLNSPLMKKIFMSTKINKIFFLKKILDKDI